MYSNPQPFIPARSVYLKNSVPGNHGFPRVQVQARIKDWFGVEYRLYSLENYSQYFLSNLDVS